MSKSHVFLDITIGNSPPERLEIELFDHLAPLAAENFRALCVGDKGIGMKTGKPLHYKGSRFYYVHKGLVVEGGDFENQDGTGGESIYGGYFRDENLGISFSGRGILMMNRHAPDKNGSRFFICLKHEYDFDGSFVAFGRVLKGMETVEEINMITADGKPCLISEITDCGEILQDDMAVSYEPRGFSVPLKEEPVALGNRWIFTRCTELEVTSSDKPHSNPHQHSDDLCKSRPSSPIVTEPVKDSSLEIFQLKQSFEELKLLVCELMEDGRLKKKKVDWKGCVVSFGAAFLLGVLCRPIMKK